MSTTSGSHVIAFLLCPFLPFPSVKITPACKRLRQTQHTHTHTCFSTGHKLPGGAATTLSQDLIRLIWIKHDSRH